MKPIALSFALMAILAASPAAQRRIGAKAPSSTEIDGAVSLTVAPAAAEHEAAAPGTGVAVTALPARALATGAKLPARTELHDNKRKHRTPICGGGLRPEESRTNQVDDKQPAKSALPVEFRHRKREIKGPGGIAFRKRALLDKELLESAGVESSSLYDREPRNAPIRAVTLSLQFEEDVYYTVAAVSDVMIAPVVSGFLPASEELPVAMFFNDDDRAAESILIAWETIEGRRGAKMIR